MKVERLRTASDSLTSLTVSSFFASLAACRVSSRRAVIGELDEDLDSNLDLSQIMAPPLKAIAH